MSPLTPAPAAGRDRDMIGDARPTLARALGAPSARQLSFGLAFLGLAAIVVGCFVPVADASSVDFDRINGNTLHLSGIGWLTLVLCGVLLMALTRSLHRGEPTWGPMIGGLLVVTEAVYIGAVELTTCPVGTNVVDSSACQAASPGLGLFMIGAGGAALALAGLELAPWRQPVPAGNLVVTGPTPTAVLSGHRASPTRRTEIAAEPTASLVSHDSPDVLVSRDSPDVLVSRDNPDVTADSPDVTAHAPAAPSLDTQQATVGDVGSHVTAVLVAAEEAARQIVADARAEAARITSTAGWLEQANAESQRRLDEEAANLLRVCRAVEDELVRALSAVIDSQSDRSSTTPTVSDRRNAVGLPEQ